MHLAPLALLVLATPQQPSPDPELAADLARIGHRDRSTAAAACARVFARGEAALPALLALWEQRPTRAAEGVGKPQFAPAPSPFELLLDVEPRLHAEHGSYVTPTDLDTPIRITDLPLPTIDETVAALIALVAPDSIDVTEALLAACAEDRNLTDEERHELAHWGLVPPLARTCAVLLRHYPNLDRDAVLRAARGGNWPAAAVLLSLGDDGVDLLRSRPQLATNAYLAMASDPRDTARMASGLQREGAVRLVATWFATANDDALGAVVDACRRPDTLEQAIAFAILAHRAAASAASRASLLELTAADFATTRIQAWMALGAGSLDASDRDTVRAAIDAALAQDAELERDETRAAWCAGVALDCLDQDSTLTGWKALLSSNSCGDARWAAVAAAASGRLPPDEAWTKGPDAAEVQAAEIDPERLWAQMVRGADARRIAACREAARRHPEHVAAALLFEFAIRMQPQLESGDMWNSAIGFGGRPGGRLPFDAQRNLDALRSGSPETRAKAARSLAARVNSLTRDQLVRLGEALADEAAIVRRELLRGLARASTPESPLPFLDRVVELGRTDPDPRVRAAAMAPIWRHADGEDAAIDALVSGTQDVDPRVRVAAATTLFEGDANEPLRRRGVLDGMLGDHDAEVLLAVADGLSSKRRCSAERERAAWVRLMSSRQPRWLRARAATLLGYRLARAEGRFDAASAPQLVAALEGLAADDSLPPSVREAARSSWTEITDNELLAALDRVRDAVIRGSFGSETFGW